MSLQKQFLLRVELFLEQSGMSATQFGKTVMNDNSFVHELRRGRSCRVEVLDKVYKFIEEFDLREYREKTGHSEAA